MHGGFEEKGNGKIHFDGVESVVTKRMREPISKKILLRFPRLSAVLAAAGARGFASTAAWEPGRLAAMMTACGSIDFKGKDKKIFHFEVRQGA